jgi:multidrug efflux pump subunit AcrA (membrane-fusion protein)
MKGRKGKSYIALATLAVFFSGCSLLPEEHLREPELYTGETTPLYEFAEVKRGDLIKEENVVCTYMSVDSEELSYNVAGESYSGIFVSVGDNVKKGDLVAELDTHVEKELLAKLLSDRTELETKLSLIKEKKDLTVKRAELVYEAASASERLRLETPSEAGASFDSEIFETEDALYKLDEQIDFYEKRIEDGRLYAGMDGTVTYVKEIGPKSTTVSGAKLIVIADLSTSLLKSYTFFKDFFPKGSKFDAEIDGRSYPVEVIDPAEYGVASKENEVFFKIMGNAYGLSDGSKGTVKVVTESARDVLYVDSKAVNSYGDEMIVFYVDENNVRSYKTVVTGTSIDGYTEIRSGVREGEEFIIG